MTRSTSHSTWIFEAVDQDGQAIVSTFKSNGTRPESIHELALEWGREVGADRVIGYAKKSAHRGPGFVLRVADDRIEYHPPLLGIDEDRPSSTKAAILAAENAARTIDVDDPMYGPVRMTPAEHGEYLRRACEP